MMCVCMYVRVCVLVKKLKAERVRRRDDEYRDERSDENKVSPPGPGHLSYRTHFY